MIQVYNQYYLLQWCQKWARSRWFSRIWNWFWLTDLCANFQKKKSFLSSREDIWRVVAFNGVVDLFRIIFIFQIAHYFWIFSLLTQPPFLYIICFLPVLSAALCVRSSDVIAVVGILFICILICYFGLIGDIFHKFVIIFTDYRALFFRWFSSIDYCVSTCHYLF